MTDVLSSLLFGRKKPKGPAPPPPPTAAGPDHAFGDFVIVGNSGFVQSPQIASGNGDVAQQLANGQVGAQVSLVGIFCL